MRGFDIIVAVLLVVGGLNWGLVGLFGFDLVASIFGHMSFISRIVYTSSSAYPPSIWDCSGKRYSDVGG